MTYLALINGDQEGIDVLEVLRKKLSKRRRALHYEDKRLILALIDIAAIYRNRLEKANSFSHCVGTTEILERLEGIL